MIRRTIPLTLGIFIFAGAPFVHAFEFTLDANYNKEIWELNQEINDKRKSVEDLERQAASYTKSLASKRREVASLSYQVSTINQTITKLSLEKEALELKIEELNLRIANAKLKIQATEEQIAGQKNVMAAAVQTLFVADKNNNMLEVLATERTISDYFQRLEGLETIEQGLYDGLESLTTLKTGLVDEQKALDQNKEEVGVLHAEVAAKTETLEGQKEAKYLLLDQTKGEEGKYQALLQDLKNEQKKVNSDIVQLEEVAREKLNRQLAAGKDLGDGSIMWPIGSRRVTAYFHDPDYPYRAVFEHPAVDIATKQGTPIQAAASGYVARAKDAGMGYSYIMLVHDNGISTVYGHVSVIHVTEGTFVTQGQIIGLSGATPGTPGAGRLTTGPHLHFEVRLNGIPVNPLNYLPAS